MKYFLIYYLCDVKKAPFKALPIDDILKTYWGYDSFRPMQREIIESILKGDDLLALLPTGGGKSLTYQVPALAMEGTAIIITPLIALMKDQVDRLRQLGISTMAIHSGMSMRQIDRAMDNCQFGSVKLLYVAPERFVSERFTSRFIKIKVSLIAVDEAHCISQWGYDFRPSYLALGDIREKFPSVPILALTASATKRVCEDIMARLHFNGRNMLVGDFSRPNLVYAVRKSPNRGEMLLRVLNSVPGTAIVYTRTRLGCESVCEFLKVEGITATYYHGGLPYAERSIRQQEWLTGEVRVMVATNAFGMGIDKPDVRLVVHNMMCDSIESYYQEAGRAGRDGVRSYAVMLYTDEDIERVGCSIEKEFPSLSSIKECYDKICAYLMICYGEGEGRCLPFDLMKFCAQERLFSAGVLKAIKILQISGYMTLLEEMENPSQVIFIVSRDDLYRVRINHPEADVLIRLMLRLYDGIFTEFKAIDEARLAEVSGYTVERIKELLAMLWRQRVIRYIPTNRTAMIRFNQDRVPKSDIYISPDVYKHRRDMYLKRFAEMSAYIKNSDICRSQMMMEYFGVESHDTCGVCDVCVEQRREAAGQSGDVTLKVNGGNRLEHSNLIESIIKRVELSPISLVELQAECKTSSERFANVIDRLILDGVMSVDSQGVVRKIND